MIKAKTIGFLQQCDQNDPMNFLLSESVDSVMCVLSMSRMQAVPDAIFMWTCKGG